jgi:hypothetical protein
MFTTINAQLGGVPKLPAGDSGQGGFPAFLPSGSTERHRFSYQYFKYTRLNIANMGGLNK